MTNPFDRVEFAKLVHFRDIQEKRELAYPQESFDDNEVYTIARYQEETGDVLTQEEISEWRTSRLNHKHRREEEARTRAINEATKPKKYLRRGNKKWLLDALYW
jgi:hypothetical protein